MDLDTDEDGLLQPRPVDVKLSMKEIMVVT